MTSQPDSPPTSGRPLAIDLFTGLHGWAEGLIAAGFYVVGFDLEDMSRKLGEPLPPEHFSLVIQDVLTLHGADLTMEEALLLDAKILRAQGVEVDDPLFFALATGADQ